MSKIIPQYGQKLLSGEFLIYFTKCCKEITTSGMTKERNEIMENLMRNYLAYHEDYNTNSTLVNSVAFWSKKLNYNDENLWKILEHAIHNRFETFDPASIISISKVLCEDKVFLVKVEDFILKNINRFNSRHLSEFAAILKSNNFVVKLFYESKLNISNELDLLYFIKECQDPSIVAALENWFRIILPKITNTQALCSILYEFTNKSYSLANNTIEILESTLANKRLPFNLKDTHHLLVFFNHSTIYGRLSTPFWEKFTIKVGQEMHRWPAAITLSYFSQEGFFISSLYEKLILNWMKDVERYLDPKVFREGFYAICNSNFLTENIISWSLTQFNKIHGFDDFDILNIARALTIKEIYISDFWNPIIEKLRFIKTGPINYKPKSMFYHIYKSIEIDAPDNHRFMLSQLQHSFHEISASYKINATFKKTYSQQYVARVLSLYNREFLQNQYIDNLYEIDLVLPDLKVGIEVIGQPYHISQISDDIYPKFRMKLRHLNKLGWKMILVRQKETAELQLHKAINFLQTIDTPLSLSLLSDEIKII